MYFKRKIYNKLLLWKKESNGKSAVLIEGARRVGKSTTAEEFARNEYDDYILLDFAREAKDLRQNFEDNIGDLDTFFRNLFIIKGKDLPRRKSVIIFDEVPDSSKIGNIQLARARINIIASKFSEHRQRLWCSIYNIGEEIPIS